MICGSRAALLYEMFLSFCYGDKLLQPTCRAGGRPPTARFCSVSACSKEVFSCCQVHSRGGTVGSLWIREHSPDLLHMPSWGVFCCDFVLHKWTEINECNKNVKTCQSYGSRQFKKGPHGKNSIAWKWKSKRETCSLAGKSSMTSSKVTACLQRLSQRVNKSCFHWGGGFIHL